MEHRSRDRDDGDRSRRSRDEEDRGSRRDRDDRGGDSGRRSSRDDESPRTQRTETSRAASRYTYERRESSAVEKRSKAGNKDFDSYLKSEVKTWKPNDGANTIRPLPPTWKDPRPEHYGLDLYVHYGVGADEATYLCLQKMKGEPCPICEERLALQKAGDADEDLLKSMEPKKRVLFYLVDRDHKKEGVQAWAAPFGFDRDVCMVSMDKRTKEALPIDDPEEGYDIEFEKKGQGKRTEYGGIAVARRSSTLGDSRWLDFALDHPLTEVLQYYDYDHISSVFGGGGSHRSRRDRDDDRDRAGGGSNRDRDRDDRSRDSARDPDRSNRGRGEDREAEPSGGRREREAPRYTWASVHDMTGSELDALVDEEKLRLKPNDFDSDVELADAICKELGIKDERDESPRERMRSMRERD